MASSELERLLIRLEVDTAQMQKALDQAGSEISKFETKSEKGFNRAANSANKFGVTLASSLRAAGAAVAAFAGAQTILNSMNTAANLDKVAANAGLTVEAFQALASAAITAGYNQERFADAAATFAMKVTEARAKSGDFYEFLKNHLPTVRDQVLGSQSMAAAYQIVADAVRNLDSDQSRALLVSKAFGESNRDLVTVLKGGGAAIQETTDNASKMAHVMDAELTKNMKEVVTAAKEIAGVLTGLFDVAVAKTTVGLFSWVKTLRDAIKGLSEFKQSAADAAIAAAALENPGQGFMPDGMPTGYGGAAAVGGSGSSGRTPTEVTVGPANGPLRLKPKVEPWMDSWQTSIDFTGVDRMRDLERQRALAVKDSATAIRLEYERELEEFRRLKAEGKIDEEEFQRARVMLNDIAGAQITESMKADREEIKQNLSEITYAIEDAISAPLRDAFAGNLQPMQTYFKQLLGNLAQAVTQMLVIKPLMDSLTSSIGGSSFMTSLFGIGKRASGGPVTGGKPYLVGENGPELMVPSAAGRVIANNGLGFGAGGSATVYNIDARGSDISVAERVQMALAMAERNRPKPVADVAAYRKRFPTRGA